MAWGPLGGDPLAGANRLFNFAGDRQLRILKVLDEVAKELGPGMYLRVCMWKCVGCRRVWGSTTRRLFRVGARVGVRCTHTPLTLQRPQKTHKTQT